MVPPIITLTTDFGERDPYVAAMKGVILSINPQAVLVDLGHNIEPQNIRQGAFCLHLACSYFPPGTIHIAVVDPGVDGERQALMVSTPEAYFLAPDNGLLSYVLPEAFRAYALTNPRYWRHPVSATFHGRDIFAPAAAHLSLGTSLQEMGEAVSEIVRFPFPAPRHPSPHEVVGEVLHIDRFGNLITNIHRQDLPAGGVGVEVAGRRIEGLSLNYASGEGLVALVGSSDYLEIAYKNGRAASLLAALPGTPVRVLAYL